ncbi:MAG: molybdate ABC transporter substrate-binding protein [Syntrophomonadaceae bacterium]|nr:molybdate ABC transporter substrate-binding protein [Syntrophomonadaceae bacterium]
MKKSKNLIAIILTIVLATGLIGCSQKADQPSNQPAAQKVELTVSAAASLTDAMGEIKTLYAQEKPDVTITYNFGSSGSLQQQIENGAAADVFLSAATKQMDALKDKGLILEDTRKNFLGNSLVLVVPKDSNTVTGFKDLTNASVKKIALGEPKSVPAGQYGEEALTKLNLLDAIKSKVVYAKDVKEVLTWVETGNADAGIVYGTDAKISEKVKVAATADPSTYTPVVYPGAVLKDSKNVDAAKDFINFLYSDKAKPVFEKYGFVFMPK